MEKTFNNLIKIIGVVFGFLFNMDTFITLLFLLGVSIILFTIYNISLIAFGFVLGFALVAAALLLHSSDKR